MGNLYRKIREKYGLSRSSMGKLLGMGVNQWGKYEDGLLEPGVGHDIVLGVVKDPRAMIRYLNASRISIVRGIGENKFEKVMGIVVEMVSRYESLDEVNYRKWVDELWR